MDIDVSTGIFITNKKRHPLWMPFNLNFKHTLSKFVTEAEVAYVQDVLVRLSNISSYPPGRHYMKPPPPPPLTFGFYTSGFINQLYIYTLFSIFI